MKIEIVKPTLKMSREEYETIMLFLELLSENFDYDYDWCDLLDDFPRAFYNFSDKKYSGSFYNVEITS